MRTIPPVRELKGICQPKDLDVCLYRRIFTRPVSIYFTRLFLIAGIEADTVSVAKGLIACTGSLLFLPGVFLYSVAGAILLQLSFVLDASDGEVARFNGSCISGRGEFIDKLGDTASRGLFYGAWGISIFTVTGDFLYLPAGMFISGVWLTARFCAVETVLESLSNHPDTPPSPLEMRAVTMLFLKEKTSGRGELILSRFYHPWINLATLAAAASINPALSRILFLSYSAAWLLNTVRKVVRLLKVTSFRRPVP